MEKHSNEYNDPQKKRSPEQYLTIYPSKNRYEKRYELRDLSDFLEN